MKLFLTVLSSMLCFLLVSSAGQLGDADPYSIDLVQMALKTRSQGIIIAKAQTHVARMGDKVSIALLKSLNEEELVDPHTVKIFLAVIRDSFSEPQLIAVDIDKKPKVTLFLLKYLQRNISDGQTLQDIDDTIRFINEKTTSNLTQ